MRFVIGCLAVVGLLVILAVGGCFGAIVYSFSSLPTIPPGLTSSAVEQRYSASLALVRRAIADERMLALKDDPLVLAVYRTTSGKTADLHLRDPTMTKTAHTLRNGAGIALMKAGVHEAAGVAYDLKVGDHDHLVVLLDDGGLIPPPAPPVAPPR